MLATQPVLSTSVKSVDVTETMAKTRYTSTSQDTMIGSDYSWPMFRHDPQLTGYSDGPAPDSPNILWRRIVQGGGFVSPVIESGIVFFVFDGGIIDRIYALNASTGEELWFSIEIPELYNSPAVAGDSVFAASRDRVYVLDKYTGMNVQNFTLDPAEEITTHLVISDDVIYLGTSCPYPNPGRIHAINKTNGEILWNYTIERGSYSGAVNGISVYENKLIATCSSAYLLCLDKYTGNFNWKFNMVPSSFLEADCPVVADGTVYVTYDNSKRGINAIDAENGSFLWKYDVGDDYISQPSIAYGRVYFTSRDPEYIDHPGYVYSVDAKNGTRIWRAQMDTAYGYVSRFTATVVADGKTYISYGEYVSYGAGNHYLVALDAFDGHKIWSHKFGSISDVPRYLDLAIAYGKLFVGGGNINVFADTARIEVKNLEYDRWNELKVPFNNLDEAVQYTEDFSKTRCPHDFGTIPVELTIENTGDEVAIGITINATVSGDVTMVLLDLEKIENDMIIPPMPYHFEYSKIVFTCETINAGASVTGMLMIPINYSNVIAGYIELEDPNTREMVPLDVYICLSSVHVTLKVEGNFGEVVYEIPENLLGYSDPRGLLNEWNTQLSRRVPEKMIRTFLEKYYSEALNITSHVQTIVDIPTGGVFTESIQIYPGTMKIVISLAIPVGVTLLGLSLLPFGATTPIGAVLVATGLAMIVLNNPFPGDATITLETASTPVNMTLEIVQMVPNNIQTIDHSVVAYGKTFHVITTSNSTISDFKFNESSLEIDFNTIAPLDTIGFCYVVIPKTLLYFFKILMDGVQLETATINHNETHTFLYFNYIGTHVIKIKGTTKPISPPDFHVKAYPESQTINTDEEAIYTINITSINNFDSEVSLSIENLPDGITYKFNPTSVIPPKNGSITSQLTLSVSKLGVYGLRVVAQSGSTKYTSDITLEVTKKPTPPPSLSVTLTLNSTEVQSGGTLSITVSVTHGTNPIEGANITLSPEGSLEEFGLSDENGKFTTTFIAPTVATKTTITITVNVTKTGYLDGQDQVQITVNPKTLPSAIPVKWIVIVILVIAAVIAIFVFRKIRKKT